MGSSLPINPFQALPEWIHDTALAANDNVALTARELANKRWVGSAAKVAVEGVGGGAMEAVSAIAVPVAFVGLMGLTSYAYFSEYSRHPRKIFTPCGTEPKQKVVLPEWLPPRVKAAPPPLSAGTYESIRAYVSGPAFSQGGLVGIDTHGKSIETTLFEIQKAAELAVQIADKEAALLSHKNNGDSHLARQVARELDGLQVKVQSDGGINVVRGSHIQIKATAEGGNADVSATAGATKDRNARESQEPGALARRDVAGDFTIEWHPRERVGGKNIHINGKAMTMPEWIKAADRARHVKGLASLAIGASPAVYLATHSELFVANPLLGACLLSGAVVTMAVSAFLSPYLFNGGKLGHYTNDQRNDYSGFPIGITLHHILSGLDKPKADRFAQVMSAWYRRLLSLANTENPVVNVSGGVENLLEHSKKTVDGVEYDLIQFMDVAPFFESASKSVRSAAILIMLESHGREWTPADEHAIKFLQVHWDCTDTKNSEVIRWLAMHGNEGVVQRVYAHALNGESGAQAIFKQLVVDRNPLALSILETEYHTGGITLISKSGK